MECTNSDVCYFYQAKIVQIQKNDYNAKKKKLDIAYT